MTWPSATKSARRIILLLSLIIFVSACTRTPEQKYARFMETGKKMLDKKDYARAVLQFRNAAKVMPKAAEPYYQMGLAYLEMRDFRTGVPAIMKATQLDPKHTGAKLKLAELMSLSNNKGVVEKAETAAQEIVTASPDNVEALGALAAAEWKLGKRDGAEEHLQQAFDRFPKNLSASVALARVKLAKKDVAGAEAILKKAAEQQPPAANSLVALAEFYAAQGKSEETKTLLRRALELDGKNPLALLDLAATELRAGRKAEAEDAYKRLASLPDKRYQPLYGAFLVQNGKMDEGLKELARLSQHDPEDRLARSRLVAAYVYAKRVPDAMNVLSAALKKNPKDTDAQLQRARVYLISHQYAEAQRDLEQSLHFRADSAEAHLLLARVHGQRGATLSQKQELSEALRLKPDLLPARIELSRLLIATRAPKEGLKVMDDTPSAQKGTFGAVAQRNWALIASGQGPEARKILDGILAKSRPPELLLQDAALKLEKNPVEARASLTEVLKQAPEDVRAIEMMTATYMNQKLPGTALQFVRDHAAQHPKSGPVQLFLARWLFSTGGDRTQVRAALEAAKAADPNLVATDIMYAQLDLADHKYDDARKRLTAMVQTNPTNTIPRLMLAGIALQEKTPAQAIEQYRKILEIEPNNVIALNDLAYNLSEFAKQSDDALKYAQQAAELAPSNPAVEDTLGWVLYQKGLYTMAVKHLETAVAGGATPRRQAHLALAYLKTGDSTRGQQVLDKAVDQDPNMPEVKMAQKMMNEMSGNR